MKIKIITLGCKVNTYESDSIKELFLNSGDKIVEDDNFDAAIVNTCTVTNQASAKSRKMIRSLISKNKKAIIAVMGCYSQAFTNDLKAIEGIDIIIGNKDKQNIVNLIHNYKKNEEQLISVDDILKMHDFENYQTKTFTNTRAFLKIEDGCNQFCSYCIIPYARGPVRSKSADLVIKDINNIVLNGYKEVVLTGIHTGKYNDGGLDITGLIKRILKETKLERLRLSSIEINEISDEFIEMMKNSNRIAHHLHIPLQSGSDHVLKLMNRCYNREQFINRVNQIREMVPDISITTDIIVGFPQESDEDFKDTMNLAKEVKFAKIHVFPFSLRDGTRACSMIQVSEVIKEERVHKLIDLDEYLEKQFMLKNINEIAEVILEEEKGTYIFGHSSNYLPILIPKNQGEKGMMVSVRITNYSSDKKLLGRRVDR